ncbi:MAG: SDR family NAD(P)-dependent oxidoreductase, partial [Alphaproteobacteria bacterium]
MTGAASGIGRETAMRFAAEGAAVVCADLDGDGSRAAADAITDAGGTAFAIPADVTDLGDVTRMIEDSLAACGK